MNLIPFPKKNERNGGRSPMETAITRFRDEMEDLFSRFMGRSDFDLGFPAFGASAIGPRMDLVESHKEFTVSAELPGVDPKEIEINVTGNVLTIRGEKKHDVEEKGRDFHYTERQYGAFHRTMQLPSAVDPAKVNATYKDGILTIAIAKHPEAQPKRIPVKAS